MSETSAQLHLLAVSLHAVAAAAAWAAGVLVVCTGRGLRLHGVALGVMTLALGPSLALGWPTFPPVARVVFLALCVLAIGLVGQAARAARVLRVEVVSAGQPVGPAFVGIVGFNLIALTVAGTVVPVLRVGGGAAGVLLTAAATVVAGHLLLARRVRQLVARPRADGSWTGRADPAVLTGTNATRGGRGRGRGRCRQ